MREPELRRILSGLGIEVLQRTHSGWLHAQCPFALWTHSSGSDRRPSFGAKVEDGGISAYQCHSCKMHGRISSLARALGIYRHEDRDHYRAHAQDADAFDRLNMQVDYNRSHDDEEPPKPVVEEIYSNMFLALESVPEALAYVHGRQVSTEAANSMGVLYDPRQRRVVFPVKDGEGRCYGFTGRGIDDAVQPKIRDYAGLKKRWHILGQERWRGGEDRRLILVEGLFAYAHLVQLNCEVVADVGAIMGSSLSDRQAATVMTRRGPTYLMFDDDEAGDICLFGPKDRQGNHNGRGAVKMLEELSNFVFVPPYPPGKIDPDQLTKAELWSMLTATRPHYRGSPLPTNTQPSWP